MSRYLIEPHIKSALSRGKRVEQFLGPRESDGLACVQYAVMSSRGAEFRIDVYEVEDVGSEDFLDIYEFPSSDPDGDPVVSIAADSLGAALDQASRQVAADPGRWVNAGVIQDEYQDYLSAPASGAV